MPGQTAGNELPERLGRVGLVCRFKPVHSGQLAMLEAVGGRSDHLLIGLGSCNRYDLRNPFTAAESRAMIELALEGHPGRREFIEVPDLGDGPRWRSMVRELFGPLDVFVTANGYVADLLAGDYRIVHPARLIPRARWVRVNGTMVRRAMARGDDWAALVPPDVRRYLLEHGLVERFRREFGLATLAADAPELAEEADEPPG